jgi:hypothetical protein
MKTYEFTLVLAGVKELDETLTDVIYLAGCDDSLLHSRHNIIYLEFMREGNSFLDVVISAIKQVESIKHPLIKVDSIQPDDFVTASEIARRINKTREYVRLLINGERGGGNFPLPIAGISQKSLIWSWLKVAQWLFKNHLLSQDELTIAQNIFDLNQYLIYRDYLSNFNQRMKTIEQSLIAV